jgi:hypothetical protein
MEPRASMVSSCIASIDARLSWLYLLRGAVQHLIAPYQTPRLVMSILWLDIDQVNGSLSAASDALFYPRGMDLTSWDGFWVFYLFGDSATVAREIPQGGMVLWANLLKLCILADSGGRGLRNC